MKRLMTQFILVAGCVVIASSHTTVHAAIWSHRFGDASVQYCKSVATDASGNVIITGYFTGAINFGDGSHSTNPGIMDIFVAKFNSSGVFQWSWVTRGSLDQASTSVATDASGNVIITGYQRQSVGTYDVFVAKLNAAGALQWSQHFGDADNQYGYGVATDASGNVIITGAFNGTVNFGGGNLTSAGSTDIFVAKLDPAGVHQWSQRFGDASAQSGNSIATDVSGNVIITGTVSGTVNFGGGNLTGAGNDVFLAKYDTNGVHQWSQRFGDASAQYGNSVAPDANGNVIVTGYFSGAVDFGGGNLTSSGLNDIFVAKFNSAGVHQWSQRFGDASDQYAYSVAVDASGNMIVTGDLNGAIDFGGGNLTSAGSTDIFVAKFNSSGVHQWSRRFGDASQQHSYSAATDANGNMFITGHFFGTINFGGADLISAGDFDVFVAKLNDLPRQPLITSIADVGNDQGRRVRIEFSGAGLDESLVTGYEAYRRNDPLPVAPALGFSRAQLLDQGWVYVGDVPAHGMDVYLMDASTDADSTITLGQHYSVFFIRATTAVRTTFIDSAPDSGYSLDNLAPGIPGSFAYNAGTLSWKKSSAQDFDHYMVYGSHERCFCTATVIDECVVPSMDVSHSPYEYYFVTAIDASGNEGAPAVVNALTGVGGTPTSYVLSISAYPNPFNPETTIRYTVPSKGRVSVVIYDARGAHVVTLVDEEKSTGAYAQNWNGRDDAGQAVSSGVYFARVTHPSGTKSYKTVLLK